jgi:RND family efflux transporter MFP subunit
MGASDKAAQPRTKRIQSDVTIAKAVRINVEVSLAKQLIACGIAILLAACKPAEVPRADEVRPVRTITIEKRADGGTVSLTGTVQAQTEVNLAFRIDGKLTERRVNVGDAVRAGQVVAQLDPQNEQSSLQGAQAQLAATRAQLAEARNNYARMRDLVADKAVSQQAFEQAEALQKTGESQVQAAQSQLNIAESRVSFTRLVSDVSGVVTATGAEPGEVVAAGRMIVQIAREGERDGIFDVPAQMKDAALAYPSITVALTLEPKVTASGRVREVSPRADPVTGTFRVKVRLIDPPAAMRLGSTVTMRMKVAGESGYIIPASAVIRSDRQAAVWIVDPKNATVSARNVDVRTFDERSVVVAAGLNPGDVVVTAGVQALRPGQKVRLLETKQ